MIFAIEPYEVRLARGGPRRHEEIMTSSVHSKSASKHLGWALALLCVAAPAGQALAWGATGHRLIGELALETLAEGPPAFLRTPDAALAVGELAREPDRWRDAGRVHDTDRDAAHFLDLDDDGRVLGGPALEALPETRAAYDGALRAVGADSWKAGYLPYAIIDGYQQLAKDFAYWRIDRAAAEKVANPAHRAWFRADLIARQALILRDLGTLAHYVGDGSQPMHVSVHYNGWGAAYPNPAGYTNAHIHGPFEGAFVHDFVGKDAVRAAMAPASDCHCAIGVWTATYLGQTRKTVIPLFELYKAQGFENGDARGRAFVAARLAAGAAALRDLVAMAWTASAEGRAGYPAVSVADVESGKIDPYDSLYGID